MQHEGKAPALRHQTLSIREASHYNIINKFLNLCKAHASSRLRTARVFFLQILSLFTILQAASYSHHIPYHVDQLCSECAEWRRQVAIYRCKPSIPVAKIAISNQVFPHSRLASTSRTLSTVASTMAPKDILTTCSMSSPAHEKQDVKN
jgi:hypothetical protein